MGQELCKVHLDLDTQSATTSSITLPDDIKDDVSYFFPLKTSFDLQELNNQKQQQISNFQLEYVKQIQKNLFSLTKPIQWEQINTKINEKFIDNILTYLYDQCKKITDEQTNYLSYQQQLQTFLTNKTINSLSNESQLSYFAIRSLVSILLILIKSVEKNDPLIIQEILSLTNQLCEELPMKSLSSSNKFLFKSLEPLTNYIQNLSSSTDPMISKQTIEIRLNFSMIKGSFKDVLPLLKNLIFNTTDIYNIQNLIIHMNDYLEKNNNDEKRTELPSFNYLKSINSYPNSELSQLPDELFTGQLISSIILSHIDIDNQLNSSTQPPDLSSLSYEFHPNTFKDLFYIIKNLSPSDKTTNHILTICLRLFRNHLKILSDVKPNLSDLAKYADENELKTWFDLLLKLSSNEIIIQEASKSLIYVINLQSASLKQRLSTLTQYLIDNKYSVLIDEILAELNKYNLLSDWIDSLCSEENKNFESLYSLIDLYFTRNDDKQKLQIQNLLFSFQYILLSRLDLQNETKTFTDNHRQLSSLVIQYLTYILKKYVHQTIEINDLFNSILLGLCLMTDTKKCFHYEFIQPIFLSILPLLTEYYLKNSDNKYLLCLVGKISQTLIIGLPQDPLEIKYTNQLKLPVLAGGYINLKQDDLFNSNLALFTKYQPVDNLEEDKDFLMSLYNNRDDGARLLTKLKTFSKTKQHLLQKSVAELVNDAIPTIFAVYVKHYRRISLAKSELLRTDETKPYDELLSLFEYATRIQSIFSTVKGQGGDCDELSKQIKQRTLFLLCSVKASDLIPIVKQETSSISIDVQSKKDSNYQRQHSNWTKAKHTIKLLRHLLQACKRFKKFMLAKKRINQQIYDYDTLVHHSIENFLYGNFYKLLSTSLTNDDDDKQFDIDQLEKCLYRQYQRAMVRLLTYRFNQIFIENLVKLNNNEQILSIYLPYLRSNDSDWSYFNHMETSNIQLKSEISYTYYSITKQILSMPNLTQNIFYLLNFSYESIDLSNLYSQQIPESLFKNYISSMKNNSTDLKFIIFNWFQLFLFKLCENIEMDLLRNTSNEMLEQHEKSIFNNLLLNEIKSGYFRRAK